MNKRVVGWLVAVSTAAFGSAVMAALPSVPGKGPARVTERGPNHRRWERVVEEPTVLGRTVQRVHTYTELATGLHYRNADLEWAETRELV